MVGKPRSQGCKRCRKHKKGCDKTRPQCNQCHRLGFLCEYEERAFIQFQSNTDVRRESGDRPSHGGPNSASRPEASAAPHTLDTSLMQTALIVQTDALFWSKYLPAEELSPLTPSTISAFPFLHVLLRLVAEDTTTRLALNAVAFLTIGRSDGNDDMLYHGMHFYGLVLRRINHALKRPSAYRSDSLLVSIRLLVLFEAFRKHTIINDPGPSFDWKGHIEGSLRLLEFLDLHQFAGSPDKFNLLRDVQCSATICSILLKEPLLKSTSRLTQFLDEHAPSTIDKHLFDIMMNVAPALYEQDRFHAIHEASVLNASSNLGYGVTILENCISIAESFQLWEQVTLRILSLTHVQDQSSPSPSLSNDTTLSSICRSHGYGFFNLVTQYWSVCVFFFTRVVVFHNFLARRAHGFQVPGLPLWLDPEHYATCIAENVHHFYEPEAGLWGAQHATICIAAGIHYFSATGQQLSTQMQTLRSAMLSSTGRVFSLGFLRSLAALVSPNAKVIAHAGSPEGREMLAQEWFGMEYLPHPSTAKVPVLGLTGAS